MAIGLPEDTRKELVILIKDHFATEHDQEIGDLRASFFLDFVLEVIGPSVYNQAIKDAQAKLHLAVTDLDLTLHEPEFGAGPR